MFRIGEFSKITQVSIRMLRYYDEQKLLEPCHIDEETGYRLYSANQIDQLNKIVFLRDMGFGVQEMKELLGSWNSEKMKQNLVQQMKRVEDNIKLEERKLKQIQGLLYDLDNYKSRTNIDITLKSLPMQHVISMRRTVPDYYCEAAMWQEFCESLSSIKNIDKLQSFAIYYDLDYREKNVDIEICISADAQCMPVGNQNIIYRQIDQVDTAACFMIYGPYDNISKAYKEFAYWLEQHKEYRMQGENRQVCHVSACHTNNPNEYITELQVPLIHILT